MKQLQITLDYSIQTIAFSDETLADAAYAKLKSTMADFKEYGNDPDRVVEIETDAGLASFKIKSLTAVLIEDVEKRENDGLVIARRNFEFKAKVNAIAKEHGVEPLV